ncbi:ATP-binding protein [Wenjunlia tyrosinilytica]|uniref:LuxR family transcriptional regulator n=1 Tax=Wenjunlia tyrosinilytica TaxID=1544741 RepID=A0A918E015_9ACTN|nr:LuxR C-terminal-related transcriptional regulator [Wenjunlia tyrosinilytica]GGO97167.1 LuxR family transcriptional regulator [Wenjunlia tyrosinilytica]
MATFVGRRHELTQIKGLLATDRLVTLTGAGGVGKTRLALRAAEDLRGSFSDGVWLVSLAGLQDPKLLVHALTAALGLRDEANRWDLATFVDHLRNEQLLIVLDNCEHMVDASASLVAALLPAARGVRVLATSREPLAVAGERIVQVPPLSLPDRDSPPPTLERLAQYDSVRLFVDRAARVVPGFTLDEGNRVAMTEVCWQLDGIPLAIELAVVRLRALSMDELHEGLQDRYRLLTAGWRDLPSRQRTLRALMDWSLDLCSPGEQAVWARSSAFRGGFELEAARAVCSAGDWPAESVFESVSGLIDKSVLLHEEQRGWSRYRMLETVREYGWSRLAESGETESVQQRHSRWYQRLVEQADEGSFSSCQMSWFTRLRLDHANVRVAMEHCLADPEGGEAALRMASGLRFYWLVTGFLGEGRRWLDQGLALDRRPTRVRAKALWVNAWLALLQGDPESAKPLLKQSHELAQGAGDEVAGAWVAQLTAYAAMGAGDLQRAAPLFQEALTRHQATSDEPGTVLSLIRIGVLSALTKDIEAGVASCQEALVRCEACGEQFFKCNALWVLGLLHWRHRDSAAATAAVRDSIRFAGPFEDPIALARAVEILAWTATTDGHMDQAAALLGALDRLWRSVGGVPFLYLREYHDQCEAEVRGTLGADVYRTAFERGAQMPYGSLLSYVLGEKPAPASAARDEPAEVLTRREREIAELVAQGMSNKEIAARLVIAQRTAESHVEHILTKLGFTSRTQIAGWAAGLGSR